MARKSVKSVTYKDVVKVQNFIERCMQLYMSPKEVVNSLLNEAKIEPELTETVWQKLEEQNPEFFKAYYTRIALKQQIEEFNKLLHIQKKLMESEQAKVASLPTSNGFHYHAKQFMESEQAKVASLPTSNGFHYHAVSSLPSSNGTAIPTITENPTSYYVSVQTAEGLNSKIMQHGLEPNLSCVFNDDGSSFGMVKMSAQGDFSRMHSIQNSNMGFQQGVNGRMTISEPKYSSSSPRMFGIDGNVMEAGQNVGNASATPIFNNGRSSFGMVDWSANGDIPSMPYSKNSNMRMQQGINGGMTVHEREYSSSSPHMFGADGNVVEAGPNVGNASATPIFNNGGSSFGMVDLAAHGDTPSMPYSKNSNMCLQQGSNGGMTLSEPGYSSPSPHMFGAHGDVMEAGPNVGNASASPVYDNGGSSFGHGDIPSMPYSQYSNMDSHSVVMEAGPNVGCASATPITSAESKSHSVFMEAGSNVGDASATPITSNESNSHSANEAAAVMDLLDTSSDLLDTCSNDFWTRDRSYPDLASLFSDEIDDSAWPSFQNFALHNFPEIPKTVEQGWTKC